MPTAAQILTDFLAAQEVKKIYGVPGESYLAVLDALFDKQSIGFINARHEGGAAFMAEAYGKLTGEVGVCFVTRGPGATQASIGVHTARQNSTPMLLFIGQVGGGMRGREAFQEVDYGAFFAPIAKWVVEVNDPARMGEVLMRAYTTALSGRAGPVVVSLPEDMLAGDSPALPPALRGRLAIPKPSPSKDDMDKLTALIRTAKRPVLLIGGGGWNDAGRAALARFTAAAGMPVLCNVRRQDLIDTAGAHYAGVLSFGKPPQVRRLLADCDVLVAVNSRFGEVSTEGWSLLPVPDTGKVLIHSHACAGELSKIYQPSLGIVTCPNLLMERLAECDVAGDWGDWLADAQAGYAEQSRLPDTVGAVNPAQICSHLNEVLADDAVITAGAGNFAIWPANYINYGLRGGQNGGQGRRLLGPQSGAMGTGLPQAIAAKDLSPARQVVCFSGDGDFQMSLQELGCAAQIGARPNILIFNNGSYGTIRMHQARDFPGRMCGTALDNPDFEKIAEAYGFSYQRVEATADFIASFDASKDGQIFELILDRQDIAPGKVLEG